MVQDLHYGLGDVYGYISVDTICVNDGKICTPNVSFVNVGYQDNMDMSFGMKASGLIGLGPLSKWTTLDLFITRMKREKTINHQIFSFMVGNP